MSQRKVLQIDGLIAGYEGVPAVRNLTLHVVEGEVVALLGPNGAGKTTTLMAISGMVKVMGGSIQVVERPVPKLRHAHLLARWGVIHVPESRGILFGLTVRENLLLARRRRSQVELSRVFEFFPQLEPLLNRRAGLCSGGEQQMIALGRAVLAAPRLLMIDEMSLGLAPLIFEDLLRVVRQLAEEEKVGVLMVEQYVDAALEVADRAAILSHGELILEGEAAALLKERARVDAAYMGESELNAQTGASVLEKE
jgi:branched-chain amino acid transport system ATP-binding protein